MNAVKTLILSESVENITKLRVALNQDKLPHRTNLTPLELDMSGYCATCLTTSLDANYIESYFLFNRNKVGDSFKVVDVQAESIDLSDSRRIIRYLPKVRHIVERLKVAYLEEADNRHWVIASSQGKDSTLVTLVIWVMLEELKPEQRKRKITIITSDTGIEPPDAQAYQKKAIDSINRVAKEKGLPVDGQIVRPSITERFAVKVIGKGVLPSNPSSKRRQCTFWWKINPVDRFLESFEEEVVIFLGVRTDESENRKESIAFYNTSFIFPKEDRNGKRIENQFMSHPIHDVTVAELWDTLAQHEVFPWGMPLDDLLEHYQDSAECPMQVGKQNQNSCGNSRNGCTICQMVKDDKMLEVFAETKPWAEGALQFRTLLSNLMFDQKMRKFPSAFRTHTDQFNPFLGVRQEFKKLKKSERDGLVDEFSWTAAPLDGQSTPFYPDNEPGSLNVKARTLLLKAALYWQEQYPELNYVSDEELEVIKYLWREEGWKENDSDLTPELITHENEGLVLKGNFTVNYGKGETTIENLVLPADYNHTRNSKRLNAVKGQTRILNPNPDKPMRYLFYVHRDISSNEADMYARLKAAERETGETLPFFFTNGWRYEDGKRIYWNIVSFVVCLEEITTFECACDYVDAYLHKGEPKNQKPDWQAMFC